MQLAFELDPPRARIHDPAVSHAAAARAKDLAKQHAVLILGALAQGPLNVDAIADVIKLNGYQVGKRMHELEKAGAIEVVPGVTALSAAGRAQRVWRRKA